MDAATNIESRLNLEALVEISRTLVYREDLAQAICAHACAELGLAGASISLIARDAGEPRLESIAAVGQHSSFIREMSMPLDNLTDASRTALGGEPIFVGNPHGMLADVGRADGIGRWRDGFGAHAYAVLALTVLEGTIGVLTLEWPEPYPFADSDRQNLRLFADVVALMLRSAPTDMPPADEAERVERSLDTTTVAAFQANSSGLVVPDPVAASWGEPPVARVWTARTQASSDAESIGFAEVMGMPSGGVVAAIGAVSSGPVGDAGQLTSSGCAVMRAAAMHGSPSGEILGMLGGSIDSEGPGASASGLVVSFHSASGALEIAMAGTVALAVLGREGRFELDISQAPPIGMGRSVPACRLRLALPGDRIALLAGQVSALDRSRLRCTSEERAHRALRAWRRPNLSPTAFAGLR